MTGRFETVRLSRLRARARVARAVDILYNKWGSSARFCFDLNKIIYSEQPGLVYQVLQAAVDNRASNGFNDDVGHPEFHYRAPMSI